MRGCFLMTVYLIATYNHPVILGYFLMQVYLILSDPTQISTPVKVYGKTYKTCDGVFPQRLSTTPQHRFDVEFHEESNDAQHGTVAHCTKNFCIKNFEKIEKNHENSGKFEKNQHFFELVQVFFHMKKPKM